MKFLKIKFLFAAIAIFSLAFVSCEEDVTADRPLSDYVGLEEKRVIEILPTETDILQTKVYATAASVDRTIEFYFDATSTADLNFVSMPMSLTIPAGSTEVPFEISIENYGLSAAGKVIRIGIKKLVGTNIAISNNSVNANATDPFGVKLFTIIARDYCPNTSVNLAIKFDNYPEETAWELYDASFNVIASGGLDPTGSIITGYAVLGYADRSTFTTDFCLASGDYTFVIYDDYGDGMYTSATVSGNYVLKLADGTILASGGGNFGSFQDTAFTIQ